MKTTKNIMNIIERLSKGYLANNIDGKLYSYVAESIIALNRSKLGKDMVELSDFLAQYDPDAKEDGFYNNRDLRNKLEELYGFASKIKFIDKKEFKRLILNEKFTDAEKLTVNVEYHEVADLISDFSFETGNECFYKFLLYLIRKEENHQRLIKYHITASTILSVAIPYLKYSFREAITHAKEAIRLNPKEVSFKEHLLFIYESPDAKEFMNKKEVESLVKEVMKDKPESYIANVMRKSLFKKGAMDK